MLSRLSLLVCLLLGVSACARGAKADSVDAQKVLASVKKNTVYALEGVHVTSSIDLSEAGSGGKALEYAPSYIDCELIFVNCTFEGDVVASASSAERSVYSVFRRDVSFINCTFLGSLSLEQCTFEGRLALTGSTVRGGVSLMGSTVRGSSSFNKAEFSSQLNLSSASFARGSSFLGMKVGGSVNMQKAHFEGITLMADSYFAKYVDISGVTAPERLELTNCSFDGRLACVGAQMGTLKMVNCKMSQDVTIEGSLFLQTLNCASATFGGRLTIVQNVFGVQPNLADIVKGSNATIVADENSIMTVPIEIVW